MKTMSSTRQATRTGESPGLMRAPMDRLVEQATSRHLPADWARAGAPATGDRSEAGRAVVDATTDDALGTDDLCGLLNRLARREVSPDELWDAARARAEQANAHLNAVCTWVDQRSVGQADGPLAGVPTLVKDNQDLVGYPTSYGSRATPDRPATASSPVVDQLLRLGLIPIAKTTLPEFGWTASAESSRFGATRNPWHTGRSAGGSSGGSAALVAAGVVPLAHGNDGGGSLRVPAAACGLVALKPSRGRIIDRPEEARMPVPIVVQGVLTRTVRDTARYLAEAERLHSNPNLPPVGLVTGPPTRRLRIGLIDTSPWGTPVAAVCRQAVEDAAVLCEQLGHHVEAVRLPIYERFGADLLRYFALMGFLMQHLGGRMLGPDYHADRTDPLTKGLSTMAVRNALQLPGSLRRLRTLATGDEPAYEACDVVLSPVTGHETPPIGYLGPDIAAPEHLIRVICFVAFTPVQNVTGAPAVSLPLARTDNGLPVGVQLAAPRGHERRLLELAFELESASPWAHRPTAEQARPAGVETAQP